MMKEVNDCCNVVEDYYKDFVIYDDGIHKSAKK